MATQNDRSRYFLGACVANSQQNLGRRCDLTILHVPVIRLNISAAE